MTNPVSGGFQFTPATGLNDTATYPSTPISEAAARQQFMDMYWQIMNEINKPTLSAAAFAQYNRLINGGFAVNQRVVSGTVTLAAGAYGHDRWKAGSGGCTYTFATVNNVTTITITAGSLVQVIEGINLVSGTYTLSWTGTAQGKIGAGAYSASGVTGAATGGTNLSIEFNVGTLSKVQFNAGDQALPFQPRSFTDELALCKRYCYALYDSTNGAFLIGYGYGSTATLADIGVLFPVEMRIPPTLIATASDWQLQDGNISVNVTALAILGNHISKNNVQLRATVASGLTQFRPYSLNANGAAGRLLIFDAEL